MDLATTQKHFAQLGSPVSCEKFTEVHAIENLGGRWRMRALDASGAMSDTDITNYPWDGSEQFYVTQTPSYNQLYQQMPGAVTGPRKC